MQRKPRTHLTYRYTLDVLLRASYKKKYVEDATREDVLDFMTYCYELGPGARTVYDKVVTVLQLFKKHGRGLMEKGDWPKYVDAIRPMYEAEELTAMFKVATEDEADMLKFILGSGFRDQEIRYLEYLDLDFRHQIARVTAKSEVGFYAEELGRAHRTAARRVDRASDASGRNARRRGRTISSSAIRRGVPTAKWIWSSSAWRSAPV